MRREILVQIEPKPTDRWDNRDAGKTFAVKEASAGQAEEWGLRAMMALGTSGITVPPEIAGAGLVGLALIGYQAFMGSREDAVLPLWREMLPACVSYVPPLDHNARMPFNEQLIEEVSTRLILREKIMEVHTGFTLAEIALRLRQVTSAVSSSPNTSTSRKPSRRSSP